MKRVWIGLGWCQNSWVIIRIKLYHNLFILSILDGKYLPCYTNFMFITSSILDKINGLNQSRKSILLGILFIILLQIVGFVSLHKNRDRLTQLDPWKPAYSNFTVPGLARWDSGWYVSIVKENYVFRLGENSNTAFFPLYPVLIKAVSYVLPINYFSLGQIISWLAFLGAIGFVYKLFELDVSSHKAVLALLLMLIFPWSFFLTAVYTESLFLFLIAGSFYFARRGKWFLAGLFGLLAGLTRLAGIFLFPALIWEFWQQHKKLKFSALWVGLIPFGLISFMVYLKIQVGSALAFLTTQSTYARKFMDPISTLYLETRHLFGYLKTDQYLKSAVFALGFVALGVGVVLLITKAKQLRSSYLIFAFLCILVPLFSGTTISIGRYLAVLFPIFLAGSMVQNRLFYYSWFSLNAILLIVLTYCFTAWYFIV